MDLLCKPSLLKKIREGVFLLSKNDEIKRDLQTCRFDISLDKIILCGEWALKYKLLCQQLQDDCVFGCVDDNLIVGTLVMHALDKIDIIDYLAEEN